MFCVDDGVHPATTFAKECPESFVHRAWRIIQVAEEWQRGCRDYQFPVVPERLTPMKIVLTSNRLGISKTNQNVSLYPQGPDEAGGHPAPRLKANRG